jgi:hypothetical protein
VLEVGEAARSRVGSAWARAAVMSWTGPGPAGDTYRREPAGAGHGLDVTAVAMGLPGVPQADELALHAVGLVHAPAGGGDLDV